MVVSLANLCETCARLKCKSKDLYCADVISCGWYITTGDKHAKKADSGEGTRAD